MKPIETEFKGYLFRSLLEARWAIFLDALRVRFSYEHQGFDLDGRWYLPDFWLPEIKAWLEIKPDFPTDGERELCSRLAVATGNPVYLFFGECWVPNLNDDTISGGLAYFPLDIGVDVIATEDSTYYFAECPNCALVAPAFAGFADRLPCGCFAPDEHGKARMPAHDSDAIVAAFTKSRQFRPGVNRRLLAALGGDRR